MSIAPIAKTMDFLTTGVKLAWMLYALLAL